MRADHRCAIDSIRTWIESNSRILVSSRLQCAAGNIEATMNDGDGRERVFYQSDWSNSSPQRSPNGGIFLSGFAMLPSPRECGFIHAAPIFQGLITKRGLEDVSSTGGLPWSGSHVSRKCGARYRKQLCFQKVACLRLLHARLGRSSSGFLEFPLSFLSNAQLFKGMASNKVEMTKKSISHSASLLIG